MREKKKKQLRLGVLYDGSPGHEKQTRGIVRKLQEYGGFEISEIHLQRNSFWLELYNWLMYFLSAEIKTSWSRKEFDLLIGTGSRTHIPMLSYKKKYSVPVICCMSPSSLLINSFDLCFVPFHDDSEESGNVFKTMGPPNCSISKGEHDDDGGLILLGGTDEKSHIWKTGSIEKYLNSLISDPTIKHWTVTSSPRTPDDTVLMVEKLAAQHSHVDFFKFEETENGWIEKQYDRNKFVWVTADSMSMIYEALTAGCSVGLLPVAWKKEKSKFRRSEEFLISKGLVVSFDSWVSGNWQLKRNESFNEAARCAEEILSRWSTK